MVFFDLEPPSEEEPEAEPDGIIDHVGMYLGLDRDDFRRGIPRHHRFISSRKSTNGPTFGDKGGRPSILDGEMGSMHVLFVRFVVFDFLAYPYNGYGIFERGLKAGGTVW